MNKVVMKCFQCSLRQYVASFQRLKKVKR